MLLAFDIQHPVLFSNPQKHDKVRISNAESPQDYTPQEPVPMGLKISSIFQTGAVGSSTDPPASAGSAQVTASHCLKRQSAQGAWTVLSSPNNMSNFLEGKGGQAVMGFQD